MIVITDRLVLDRQLQETIYQFEHARGVVEKIDKDSGQLAEALAGEQARIIITTLQKFPFVLQKVEELPARKYAVIVDEAHSSQTGEAAKELRVVLGGTEEQELTVAEAEDAGFIAPAEDPVEEALAKAVTARGRQKNLSFFAFTATPKARTLETVRHLQPGHRQVRAVPPVLDAPGHRRRLHPGRARQLHDLQDLLADREGDHRRPRVPDRQGARGPSRGSCPCTPTTSPRRPRSSSSTSAPTPPTRSADMAKAMVVTSSRLHAVRYKQAIDEYIAEKKYTDLAALVAFSGDRLRRTG